SIFAITAVARVWNAANFAGFEEERRNVRKQEERLAYIRDHMGRYPDSDRAAIEKRFSEENAAPDVTSVGSLIITAAIAAIGILAYIVGQGTDFTLQGTFGFFLCFAFIGVFVVVVFIDVFDQLPLA